jgi:hypothetical protein
MKKLAALFFVLGAVTVATAATSVGVSIDINQPGVYGRINIGNVAPTLVYPQPVVIVQSPVARHQQPIYLYVPPAHQKHWDKHCARYNACGQPVYFVQEQWVRERYAQQQQERRGERGQHGRQDGRERRDHDRGDVGRRD